MLREPRFFFREGHVVFGNVPSISGYAQNSTRTPPRNDLMHLLLRSSLLSCQGVSSQRSLHNAPIFRLLLKVAVNGTHQCDYSNFCGNPGSQRFTRIMASRRCCPVISKCRETKRSLPPNMATSAKQTDQGCAIKSASNQSCAIPLSS